MIKNIEGKKKTKPCNTTISVRIRRSQYQLTNNELNPLQ